MHMVLCMNLTAFAWECYDGQMRTVDECDEAQRKDRITEMPSLLAFFGYWYVARLIQLLFPWCAGRPLDAL